MKVTIIGGTGKFGRFFANIFKDNFSVSRKNMEIFEDSIKQSEAIIISIPQAATRVMVEKLKSLITKDQLVIDLSSSMNSGIEELECNSAYLHPLFAPSYKNLSEMRLSVAPNNDSEILTKFLNTLKEKGLKIIETTKERHEKIMGYVQAMSHFSGMTLAKTLAESNITSEEFEYFKTPYFGLIIDAISRMLNQDSSLYAHIQFENKEFSSILNDFKTNLEQLERAYKNRDETTYEEYFNSTNQKLGELIQTSYSESNEIMELLPSSKIKVGMLGPKGSFSEVAANGYDSSAQKVFFESFPDIISAVENGAIDFGVIPTENSIGGTINESIDGICEKKLSIVEEIVVPISHCIAGLSEDIIPSIIMSHPQALAQCSEYIKKNYPNAKLVKTNSTSEAFRKISTEGLVNAAAIGTNLAAKQYDLKVIDSNIQNNDTNKTRFAAVSREPNKTGEKTTLAITPNADKVGLLFTILEQFKNKNLNLSRIESRPSKEKLGVYIFILDIDAPLDSKEMQDVLTDLRGDMEIQELGCYGVKML